MTSRRRSGHRLLAALAFLVLSCAEPAGGIRDDAGRSVVLAGPVRRLVTLAPNVTEIVAYAGAMSLLVGVDDSSDFPPEVRRLSRVGSESPSVEKIVSLHPDLVIGRTNGSHPSLVPALESAGVPVYLVRTETIDEVGDTIGALGSLLGLPGAKGAEERFRSAVEKQRRTRAKTPRVLIMVWPEPLYVAGRGNYADDLLELAGAENAVAVSGWPQLSIEPLIASSPDLIIYPRSIADARIAELFQRDARWGSVAAVNERMIFAVPDDLFFRQGPRLSDAAAELNAILDHWESAH